MGFFAGDRAVLDILRNDEHFAGAEGNLAVPHLDVDFALQDEEEVVGIVVFVPDKLTQHFDDHHVMAVALGHGAQ